MHFLKFTESKSFQDRFNFIRDLLIILGILFAGVGLVYAGSQAKDIKQQITDAQKVNSANFALDLNKEIESKYLPIAKAIEGTSSTHPGNFPLLKQRGGQFTESDIMDYVSKLDDVGALMRHGVLDEFMAYDEFSYSLEKAWCNDDVNTVIKDERSTEDKSVEEEAYGFFQEAAERFLQRDNKTCADMHKE